MGVEYRDPVDDPHSIEDGTRIIVDLADDCYYMQSEVTVDGRRRGPRDNSTMYACTGSRGHHNTLTVRDNGEIFMNSPTGRHDGKDIYEV